MKMKLYIDIALEATSIFIICDFQTPEVFAKYLYRYQLNILLILTKISFHTLQ